MLEPHITRIEAAIHGSALIATYSLNAVEHSPNTGYVEGEIIFTDGSRLVYFEFLRRTQGELDREKYRFHFMEPGNQLIFRYDNAPHHPQIRTFPHHKHLPTGVIESPSPRFEDVIQEIEAYVLGIP
ncbi:MAG: hypothetical protein FJ011_26150 [Chloroflexi bacterium]|nr:hypothetical protein [Chloroflexota bacterium]